MDLIRRSDDKSEFIFEDKTWNSIIMILQITVSTVNTNM